MANNVRFGVGVKDDASGPIDKIRDKFDHLQKQGAKGFGIGVGAAATTMALSAVGTAVGAVIGNLGNMVQAAKDEEVSIARLTTAIQANVEGWEGSIPAIEEVLAARIKLGYSDDEQRASLAGLVAITKDSTKALDIQRTAMDLARLKGLDLSTATELLGKVAGGNVRILRRYGIVLDKNATSTEALAAIQKMAAGQAEAWAETNTGKLAVSEIRVAEAGEKLGAVLTQVGAVVMPVLADAVEEVVDALFHIGDASRFSFEEVEAAAEAGSQAAGAHLRAMEAEADKAREALEKMGSDRSLESLQKQAELTKDDVVDLGGATGDLEDAEVDAEQAAKDFEQALKDAGNAAEQSRKKYEKTTDQIGLLADAMFGADQKTGDLAQAKKDLDEILKEGPETKSAGNIAIWKGKVAEAREELFLLQLQMARAEGPAALMAFLQDVIAQTDLANTRVHALALTILNTMASYKGLIAMASAAKDDIYIPPVTAPSGGTPPITGPATIPPTTTTSTSTATYIATLRKYIANLSAVANPTTAQLASLALYRSRLAAALSTGGGVQEFASGGTVLGPIGSPQLAVVHGGETVVPAPGRSGGGVTLNMNITLAGSTSPGSARAFADEVGPAVAAWMQRNGLLVRGGSPIRG